MQTFEAAPYSYTWRSAISTAFGIFLISMFGLILAVLISLFLPNSDESRNIILIIIGIVFVVCMLSSCGFYKGAVLRYEIVDDQLILRKRNEKEQVIELQGLTSVELRDVPGSKSADPSRRKPPIVVMRWDRLRRMLRPAQPHDFKKYISQWIEEQDTTVTRRSKISR